MRIYVKTPDYDSFVADMKHIDQQLNEVQPERNPFVREDEGDNDFLVKHTHTWTIVYHGKMVQTPAEIDEEGNVITEAVMWDGERADIYLLSDNSEQLYQYLDSQGILTDLPNGSEFVTPNPETPDAILSGEEI